MARPVSRSDRPVSRGDRPVSRGDGVARHESTRFSMEHFEKQKVLGRGAFGVAVLVREKEPKGSTTGSRHQDVFRVIKQVNLAELPADKRKETINEVEVLKRLESCPNVVAYLGAFLDGSVLNIVMEYADGGDLSGAVRQRKDEGIHFDESVVLKIIAQCIYGLNHMHRQRILHRDIKGQNIFLTKSGQAKLGDFGIAKIFSNTGSHAETCIGTPSYLAPEVCENMPYGGKADIWSIGVVLYELMALEVPFKAYNIAALVIRILTADPPALPEEYSDDLKVLTQRMLKKKPEDRPSADEILNEQIVRQKIGSKFDVTNTSTGFRPRTGDGTRPGSRGTRRRPLSDDSAVDPLDDSSWQPSSSSKVGRPSKEVTVLKGVTQTTMTMAGVLDFHGDSSSRLNSDSTWQHPPDGEFTLEAAPDELEKLLLQSQEIRGSTSTNHGGGCQQASPRAAAIEDQLREDRKFAQQMKLKHMAPSEGGFCFGAGSTMHSTAASGASTAVPAISGYSTTGWDSMSGEFVISVSKAPGEEWGLDLALQAEDGDAILKDIVVEGVASSGFFARWNLKQPIHAVRVGDRIVKVNKICGHAAKMVAEWKDNRQLEITVRRGEEERVSSKTSATSEQRGRTMREAPSGISSALGGGGSSPSAAPRSPLLGVGTRLAAETTAKSPVPSRNGSRAPRGGIDSSGTRSSSRPGQRPAISSACLPGLGAPGGSSRPGSSTGSRRPDDRSGSSTSLAVPQQRQGRTPSVVSRGPGPRQLLVSGSAAMGQATSVQRGASKTGSRPSSVGRPSSRPQPSGNAVNAEALDEFMKKVEEQQQAEQLQREAQQLDHCDQRRREAQPLQESSSASQKFTQELTMPERSPLVDTAMAKERFPHFARFADSELSLSKPCAFVEQGAREDHDEHMEDLLAQIAELDSKAKPGSRGPSRGASPGVDDDTWGVAPLPAGMTDEWNKSAEVTAQLPGSGRRPLELTDSWGDGIAVCASQNATGALAPESPSCGETAALEMVLLGGGG